MDTADLVNLLANAAVTILTTVIITRVSLGKPAFVSGASIKSALRRHGSVVFAALGFIMNTYAVIQFLGNGLPVRKFDVLFVPLNAAGAFMFAVTFFGLLVNRRTKG